MRACHLRSRSSTTHHVDAVAASGGSDRCRMRGGLRWPHGGDAVQARSAHNKKLWVCWRRLLWSVIANAVVMQVY